MYTANPYLLHRSLPALPPSNGVSNMPTASSTSTFHQPNNVIEVDGDENLINSSNSCDGNPNIITNNILHLNPASTNPRKRYLNEPLVRFLTV